MKLAMLHTLYSRDSKQHRLGVVSTPWWRHAVWCAYHWYDMRVPVRIPGWSWLYGWLDDHGAEPDGYMPGGGEHHRLRDRLFAWTINQDFRCYRLDQWAHPEVAFLEIDQETYDKIKES